MIPQWWWVTANIGRLINVFAIEHFIDQGRNFVSFSGNTCYWKIRYENKGCPIQFGEDGLPKPAGGLGVPENLEIIAITPATLAESDRSPFPKVIPLEDREILTRVTFGEDTPQTRARLMRGHAVMASFACGKGEVFNAGTTEWVHGLAAQNSFVEQITKNVFKRFGLQQNSDVAGSSG